MKTKLIAFLCVIGWSALAQFGPTTTTKFPYTNDINPTTVFVIGNPGSTNLNLAASNALPAIAQEAGYQWDASKGTNGSWRPVWNVKNYGAVGNGTANDSVAVLNAVSNSLRYGGTVYFPRGAYLDTNIYSIPALATNGPTLVTQSRFSSISFAGDGMGASVWLPAITNAVFIKTPQGNPPAMNNLSLWNVNTSSSNVCVFNEAAGYGSLWNGVEFKGWKTAARIGGTAGMWIKDVSVTECYNGIILSGYSDGCIISGRFDNCVAGVIVGSTNTLYTGVAQANNCKLYITGNRNRHSVVLINAKGTVIEGATESGTNGVIAIGYPPGILTLESNSANVSVGPVLVMLNEQVNQVVGNTNALVKFYDVATQVDIFNATAQSFVESTLTGGDTVPVRIRNSFVANRIAYTSTGASVPGAGNNVNMDLNTTDYKISFTSGAWITNRFENVGGVVIPSARIIIGQAAGVNAASYVAGVNSFRTDAWAFHGGDSIAVNAAKNMRVTMVDYAGSTTPQVMLYGYISGSGTAQLFYGGGTGSGKPFSQHVFRANSAPGTASSGTTVATLDINGLVVNSGNITGNGNSVTNVKAFSGTNGVGTVTPNINLWITNQDGQAYEIAARKP